MNAGSVFLVVVFLFGVFLMGLSILGIADSTNPFGVAHPKAMLNLALGLVGLWLAVRSAQRIAGWESRDPPQGFEKKPIGLPRRFAIANLIGIAAILPAAVVVRSLGFERAANLLGVFTIAVFLFLPVSILLLVFQRVRKGNRRNDTEDA